MGRQERPTSLEPKRLWQKSGAWQFAKSQFCEFMDFLMDFLLDFNGFWWILMDFDGFWWMSQNFFGFGYIWIRLRMEKWPRSFCFSVPGFPHEVGPLDDTGRSSTCQLSSATACWTNLWQLVSPVEICWNLLNDIWVCLKIVYPYTQWLMIIIPMKNGYFIGGIPIFRQTHLRPLGAQHSKAAPRTPLFLVSSFTLNFIELPSFVKKKVQKISLTWQFVHIYIIYIYVYIYLYIYIYIDWLMIISLHSYWTERTCLWNLQAKQKPPRHRVAEQAKILYIISHTFKSAAKTRQLAQQSSPVSNLLANPKPSLVPTWIFPQVTTRRSETCMLDHWNKLGNTMAETHPRHSRTYPPREKTSYDNMPVPI